MTVSKEPKAADATKLDPQVVRVSLALVVGAIASIFDTTIVSVALHDLGLRLHSSVDTIQWVSTSYLLAMFVAIPATGWLQNRLGGKRLWIASLGVFLLGSVLCACAWDAGSLIAFRVLQGLGGGIMMPLLTTLVMQASRGQNLGRLMAVVGLPASLGPILGPVIGGVILTWLDWRWLFLVNVPIVAVGVALAVRVLPDDRPAPGAHKPAFDLPGFALLTPGVVAILFGLSNVSKAGGFGRSDVWGSLVLGLALTTGFVAWALPRPNRALLDVHLLRHRPLAVGSLLMLLTGAGLYGAMLLLPLFWQEVRGHTPLEAGLLLIPQGVGALVSRSLGGRLTDDIGPRFVAVTGFALMAVTTIPFGFAGIHPATGWLTVVLFLRGLGLGMVFTPLMSVAFVGLESHEMAQASVFVRVAQQLGGSMGTAVLAVILAANIGPTPASLEHGFQVAFWWTVGFTSVATALSFLLPGRMVASPVGQPVDQPAGGRHVAAADSVV